MSSLKPCAQASRIVVYRDSCNSIVKIIFDWAAMLLVGTNCKILRRALFRRDQGDETFRIQLSPQVFLDPCQAATAVARRLYSLTPLPPRQKLERILKDPYRSVLSIWSVKGGREAD